MKKWLWFLGILLFNQTLYAAEQPSTSASSFPAVPQILGGYDATAGAWPWMTAILYADEPDHFMAQFCGGTLIASNWVLTAGHCVDGLVASDIQVAVGAHDLKNYSGSRIQVKNIVRHPNYANFKTNDLALLELNVSSAQQVVTIFSGASKQGIDVTLLNQMTTLTGWGLADTPTTWYYPSILQQVDLPVVANSNCNDTYGETLLSSQLCAGYPIAKDACTGDSGDPMMLMIDGQWTHVGTVSYGADCQQSEGIYGVYTRSSAFVDFIKQYVPTAKFTTATTLPVITPKDFSWPMFLPAIIGKNAKINPKVTCENIEGCYEGTFNDNCPGTVLTGRMHIRVNADCSFNSFGNSGVQASGSITDRSDSVYTGKGQTDANGCGAFSLTCTDTGASVACNYTYSNGKTGLIPNAAPIACKPINRLKTEMLAGSWQFAYQILTMFTSDYDLDSNSVKESSFTPGEYYIYGNDQWGDLVVAGYAPTLGKYDLYDSGITIDRYYTFSFIGNGLISGCYYQIDLSDNSWSSCYPMSGTLLSLAKNASLTEKLEKISQEENETKLVQEVNKNKLGTNKTEILKPGQIILDEYNRLKSNHNKKQ